MTTEQGKRSKSKAAKTAAQPSTEEGQAGGGQLPLFYRRPVPLGAERHGSMSMVGEANYRFAAEATAVPVNTVEFTMLTKHYPIVFAPESPPTPLAVLGLKQGRNLFVDKEGGWLPQTYVPAYVRRYPFIFMTGPDQLQYVLCLDEESDLVIEEGGRPFFDGDGKPTELTQNALKFCSAFQGLFEATREFGAALAEHDLLVENRADVTLRTGARLQLGGFKVIDEGRFNALPGEVFLEWREKGYLPLVYSVFSSASNWGHLVDMYAEKQR